MTSEDLRKKFIGYFESKGHMLVPPASLIPENDPSVLFTTAGMQQFKKYYLNPKEAPAKNVVTCQPCVRTSDIEEVGDDTHLTFFEMLGNFSFGGYGKIEAIKWGYEFLTVELKIDSDRIKCSIFAGDDKNARDNESADILKSMGLKFEEHNREDNFWGPTGNEGPCGPTVEFYIDNIEVWNLVFNEYYKNADGSYQPLKTKGIDTGLGLDRMLVVINNFKDVYETDLFLPVINEIEKLSGKKYLENQISFRIMADHIHASVFLLSEGIYPGNKGQDYILRRLLRQIIIRGQLLSIEDNYLKKLVLIIIENYSSQYPQLKEKKDIIIKSLEKEASDFGITLQKGLHEFEKISDKDVSGEIAFKLFDTYGFPIEMTLELAKEKNIKVDKAGFDKAFKKHQEISRAGVTGFKGGLVGQTGITTRMHTATHLLLKALQEVLGKDIHQRGSNINEQRIRFDFSYPKPMTQEEIQKVEDIVNQKISQDLKVTRKETTIEEAKKLGAEAQFLSKYGIYDKLTIYIIGDYSRELCGGPHVKSTAEIGKFKITKEESSSSGVRRIRAILE